jgi:hypothetical protein
MDFEEKKRSVLRETLLQAMKYMRVDKKMA